MKPQCPRSSRYAVARWEHSGACFKRGDEMASGEKITM